MDSIFPAMIKAKGGSITKARLSNTLLGKELYRASLTQEAFAEKVGISARYVRIHKSIVNAKKKLREVLKKRN